MDQLDRQLWEQLSPLIDQVLELDAPRRATFLSALDVDRPDLAAALGRLLAAHDRAAAEDFPVGPSMAATPAAGAGRIRVGACARTPARHGRHGHGGWAGAATSSSRCHRRKLVTRHARCQRGRSLAAASILARLTRANIARMCDAGVTPMGQPCWLPAVGQRIGHYAVARALVRGRLELFLQVADGHARAPEPRRAPRSQTVRASGRRRRP
jgi:hypothetical protein